MRCCRQTLGFYFFTKQWLHITEYNSAQCTSGRLCKPSHVWKLMEHWLGRKKGVYRKACIEWCAKCKRHGTDIKFYKWWQQDHAYFLLCQNKIAQRWYRMEWEVSRLRVMKKEVVKFAGEKAIQVRSFFPFMSSTMDDWGKYRMSPWGTSWGSRHDITWVKVWWVPVGHSAVL